MTYEEAAEATVTRGEARYEVVNQHNGDWEQFTAECGDLAEYSGAVVLRWLGY